MDELQRRVQLEALALAFAGTFLALLAGSLLSLAGFEEPSAGIVIILMAVFWSTGQVVAQRRYR